MPERKFSRKSFLKLVALSSLGLATHRRTEQFGELETYHRPEQVGSTTLKYVLENVDHQSSTSLAFLPDADGKYRIGIPGIVADKGELPPRPVKDGRPNWPKEVLLSTVFKGPSDRPLVALTIDDGFLVRDEILDLLIAKKVSATLFIIGRVMDADPNSIKRFWQVGKEYGIELANHTYSHGDQTKKTAEETAADIARCEETLKRIVPTATTVPYIRPGGGSYNQTTVEVAANLGYRNFLWTVEGDTRYSSSEEIINNYLWQLDRLANPWGAIILCHFIPKTLYALGSIIDGVRARGIEPVSLSRLYEGGRV